MDCTDGVLWGVDSVIPNLSYVLMLHTPFLMHTQTPRYNFSRISWVELSRSKTKSNFQLMLIACSLNLLPIHSQFLTLISSMVSVTCFFWILLRLNVNLKTKRNIRKKIQLKLKLKFTTKKKKTNIYSITYSLYEYLWKYSSTWCKKKPNRNSKEKKTAYKSVLLLVTPNVIHLVKQIFFSLFFAISMDSMMKSFVGMNDQKHNYSFITQHINQNPIMVFYWNLFHLIMKSANLNINHTNRMLNDAYYWEQKKPH